MTRDLDTHGPAARPTLAGCAPQRTLVLATAADAPLRLAFGASAELEGLAPARTAAEPRRGVQLFRCSLPPLLVFMLLLCPATAAAQTPIVYVRCARTTDSLDVTGEVVVAGVSRTTTRTMHGLDVYDVLPDVQHFFGGFSAPCDLMQRNADGSERVLFDCSSSSTDAASCAAMDPAVSFDAGTVAFTVFRGPLTTFRASVAAAVIDPAAENRDSYAVDHPNRTIRATEAQLHLVDIATGSVTALPHTEGVFDAGPAFLPDGRLSFTSTRDGSTITTVFGTGNSSVGSRIYAMDLDGRNVDLVGQAGLSRDEHPFVLADGRVAFSSWQLFGAIPFRHGNGAVGGFTTLLNLFHIYTHAPDGSGAFAFFGQHAGDHRPISSIRVGHNAAHFLTQTSDGRVWFADYYRGNNNGLGHVIGVMPEAEGIEGLPPDGLQGDYYAPTDAVLLAPWATSADSMAAPLEAIVRNPNYADPHPWAGKVGHPSALPGNGLMVVYGQGPCSTASSADIFEHRGLPEPAYVSGSGLGTAMNVVTSLGLDAPGCDTGLYEVTRIPSIDPSDLRVIVDTREWHEIQGRALVPYAAIHGIERPVVIPRASLATTHHELEVGTPFGLLGAASMIDRETHPAGGIHFAGEHQFGLQGTDTIDYDDSAICGVRILGILPNRSTRTWSEIAGAAGERVAILGEVPVRNLDDAGNPRLDDHGQIDTSFLIRMPADMPYLMQAIDCDGRTLSTDQSWQSLRPGESRTCGGCHVHSRPSVSAFEDTFASTPTYAIPHLGEGTVPLLSGESAGGLTTRTVPGFGLQVDFTRDILPIFERRCVSCHGGSSPAADLALDQPALASFPWRAPPDGGSTWWCLVADRSQQCLPAARRFDTGAGSSGTAFRRPQLTRYVRAFNALGSLLYWKASGHRTDGRTDDTFDDSSPRADRDLDFGAAHPTSIAPEELGLLSRWIDTGASGGPMELRDTHRPTLELAATVVDRGVQELRVGTADLGSGVDVDSLVVCVLGAGAECSDLSGAARPAGVVVVSLSSPLTDPDVEVLARVSDLAGNQTELRRTVGWLLNAPAPAPERPDAGALDGGGPPSRADDGGGPSAELRGVSGCGCSVPARRAVPLGSLLGLLMGASLVVIRRRRPRRRTVATRSVRHGS